MSGPARPAWRGGDVTQGRSRAARPRARPPAGELVLAYAEKILGLSAELDSRVSELTDDLLEPDAGELVTMGGGGGDGGDGGGGGDVEGWWRG